MTIAENRPLQIVELPLPTDRLATADTQILLQTDFVQVMRLVVLAGTSTREHTARGAVLIECVQGQVMLVVDGAERNIRAQQWICVPEGTPHHMRGLENSTVLLTIITRPSLEVDQVQEASEESFPASDPPSHTPIVGA